MNLALENRERVTTGEKGTGEIKSEILQFTGMENWRIAGVSGLGVNKSSEA